MLTPITFELVSTMVTQQPVFPNEGKYVMNMGIFASVDNQNYLKHAFHRY